MLTGITSGTPSASPDYQQKSDSARLEKACMDFDMSSVTAALNGGEDYEFEKFSVRVIPSLHSAFGRGRSALPAPGTPAASGFGR